MHRALLIATVVLFILVNTESLWDIWLGPDAFLVFMIMALGFFILCIWTLFQVFTLTQERFSIRGRMVNVSITAVLLLAMYMYPGGIVRFGHPTGNDVLVAWSEGAANCNTTFRLKEKGGFIERSVCFGVTEISGNYELKGDTILFKDINLGRHEKEYFQYAVIKPTKPGSVSEMGDLIRYKNKLDTVGQELWIKQNQLNKD